MADVEANVDITVEGGGSLAEAAAEAKELASALHEDRDAAAELGASGAEVEGLSAELGHARDQALELAAAQDAAKSKMSGLAGGGAFKGIADELGLTASELQRKLPMIAAIGEEAHARLDDAAGDIERMGQATGDTAEKQAADLEKLLRLSKGIQSAHLSGMEVSENIPASLERYDAALENLKRDLADAEPRIDAMNTAIGDSAQKAGIASHAMENWHAVASDRSSSTPWESLVSAPREMEGALSDFGRSSDESVRALEDIGRAGENAGRDLEGLAGGGGRGGILGAVGSAFGDFGRSVGGVFKQINEGLPGEGLGSLGGLSGAGMPAMWTSLAAAISTIGPVLLSAGAGFASFGAMAYPALRQVEQGVVNVTTAQKAYQQAQAVYAADPTKTNLTAEKTALAQLQATYSTMPAPIRKSVMAIQDLGRAWSEAGKKSGIQEDALKDIPKAIRDIKGLIPSVTGLAKATAPVISGMLSDFGKFEKSSGFSRFIRNIEAEVGPGSRALHSFGNAFSTLTSDLTSKTNLTAGNKLLTSLSGLLKDSSGGGVSGLGHIANGITDISNALAKAEKAKSGPGESALNMIIGGGEKVGGLFSSSYRLQNRIMHDATTWLQSHGNAQMSQWVSKHLGINIPGQGTVPGSDTGKQVQNAISNWDKNLKGLSGKPTVASIKLKVDDFGAAKAKADLRDISSDAKKAGSTKADVKVSATGADKAKSDIKDVGAAAKQAGHEKVDIKTQTTGASQAKSDLDSLRSAAGRSFPSPHITISMTGAQSAESQLGQVGSAAGQMASGVASGASRAESATTAMAAQMKAAVASIPGAFRAAGAAAGAGMAEGIQAGTGAAVAAARSMAQQVENAARVELQTKSPSKKFRKIGADTILGYILGLEGGKSAVQAAMNAAMATVPFKDATITNMVALLRKKLEAAQGPGFDNPLRAYQASGLTKMLGADNKRLMALAKQRQQLVNQIQAADALAKSVESAAISGASLTSVAGNTIAAQQQADLAEGAPGTSQNPYQNIQQGLQNQLSQIRQFRADIVKLKKEGLDKRGIQQILAAGVSGGLPVAQQILAEGSGGVKAIAKLDNEIGLASKKLGITGANAAYESASQIGKALAQGLKDSLKAVDSEMGDIAKTLVTSIMTALGASAKDIKAAIQKMDRELGLGGSGSGSGTGKKGGARPGPIIDHRQPRAAQPGPVVYRPPPQIAHPAAVQGSGGGGGTEAVAQLHANITVNIDGKQLARTTEVYTLRRAKRRPQTYPELPGRTGAG